MAFGVELRESGGIANLRRSIALKGTRLSVSDHGQVSFEKEVPQEAVQVLLKRALALEGIKPRRAYGYPGYTSDALTTELAIFDDSRQAQVEVVFDPSDPAPPQFWDLVKDLQRLIRIEIEGASAAH